MNNTYNDYGFCEDNPGVVKSDVKGIDDKVIGSVYTLQEEERAWKKELKQHIINEHEETREKVNEHTTDEVTEAKNTLMNLFAADLSFSSKEALPMALAIAANRS